MVGVGTFVGMAAVVGMADGNTAGWLVGGGTDVGEAKGTVGTTEVVGVTLLRASSGVNVGTGMVGKTDDTDEFEDDDEEDELSAVPEGWGVTLRASSLWYVCALALVFFICVTDFSPLLLKRKLK